MLDSALDFLSLLLLLLFLCSLLLLSPRRRVLRPSFNSVRRKLDFDGPATPASPRVALASPQVVPTSPRVVTFLQEWGSLGGGENAGVRRRPVRRRSAARQASGENVTTEGKQAAMRSLTRQLNGEKVTTEGERVTTEWDQVTTEWDQVTTEEVRAAFEKRSKMRADDQQSERSLSGSDAGAKSFVWRLFSRKSSNTMVDSAVKQLSSSDAETDVKNLNDTDLSSQESDVRQKSFSKRLFLKQSSTGVEAAESAQSAQEPGVKQLSFASRLLTRQLIGEPDVVQEHEIEDDLAVQRDECPICFSALHLEAISICVDRAGVPVCGHFYHDRCLRVLKSRSCIVCHGRFSMRRLLPHVEDDPEEWFAVVDLDQSGGLNRQEVCRALAAQLPVSRTSLDTLLKENWRRWDRDNDGQVDLLEFMNPKTGMLRLLKQKRDKLKRVHAINDAPDIRDDLRAWFEYYDFDKTGSLDKTELVRALIISFRLSKDAVITLGLRRVLDAVWPVFDDDDDMSISKEEFLQPKTGLGISIVTSLNFQSQNKTSAVVRSLRLSGHGSASPRSSSSTMGNVA